MFRLIPHQQLRVWLSMFFSPTKPCTEFHNVGIYERFVKKSPIPAAPHHSFLFLPSTKRRDAEAPGRNFDSAKWTMESTSDEHMFPSSIFIRQACVMRSVNVFHRTGIPLTRPLMYACLFLLLWLSSL